MFGCSNVQMLPTCDAGLTRMESISEVDFLKIALNFLTAFSSEGVERKKKFWCSTSSLEKAFKKLERVYGYVRGTMQYGIILGASSFTLKLYTDAAYALHENGRSHTGLVITFDGEPISGPIYCKSHIQKVVTLSSTESEMVALVEGVRRLIPLVKLLKSLGLATAGEPALIMCDNKSVLHMISNGEGCPGKAKYMRVRWHFVSELMENNFIRCEHLQTNLMIADMLTKPMGGAKFREFRGRIMNCLVDEEESEESEESED